MIIGKYDPLKGERYSVIDENGVIISDAILPPDELLIQIYREMVLIRTADDKAFSLQRQGRIGTYPQLKGSEGIQVGSAHGMKEGDWLVPSYREHGLMHLRGVPLGNIYLYWAGNEMGSHLPDDTRVLPVSIPVGSQTLHAVGIGMSANIRNEKLAVLACFGDGAVSEGECHEAFNFAGVFKTPVVFLCSNNQFAISVRNNRQTASNSIAQKAIAYGFDGVIVDGMDAVAVYQVVTEAMDKARSGGGPTLIEAVTYRISDHTTADDASIYRDVTEVEAWKSKEPVLRLKKFLESRGLWSSSDEDKLLEDVLHKIDEGVSYFESKTAQTPGEIFGATYATLPENLKWQLVDLKGFLSRRVESEVEK